MSKHRLQLLVYLSAISVSVGLLLPLANFPVYGEASYYRIAKMEAILVMIFAMSAPAFILAGKQKMAILSPLAAWAVLFYPTIRSYFESTNDTILRQVGNELSSAMVNFSSRLFLNIGEFHWGGFVFLTGLIIFSLSSIVYRIKL